MSKQIVLDGANVDFEEGETLFEICQRIETSVPSLCYDPRLEPLGSCRLCVVEVEGMRAPVASCTTKANAGMVVHTKTDIIERHRKTILEMVCSENTQVEREPLRGRDTLELANWVDHYKADTGRFAGKKSGCSLPVDDNPFILRDYDLCISCYRCVRVCAEQEGDYAISILNRGFDTQIGVEFGGSLKDSACTFCGQCVQTCPTGALADKKALRAVDRPGKIEKTRSVCGYCGVGCEVDILTKEDKIVAIQAPRNGKANEGALCVKGQFAFDYVHHPDRLKQPQVRKNGNLVPVSWEEALDTAASGFRKVIDTYGRHSVYNIASGRAPHEAAYLVQKFVRGGLGTHHVDNCSRA